MAKIVFTVTNDLNYDQRMIRICTSLTHAGYDCLLVGYTLSDSKALNKQDFRQKRINCIFKKGKPFYLEYNLRLFFFLLFSKMDGICAIDLDTILPCYLRNEGNRKPPPHLQILEKARKVLCAKIQKWLYGK
jgi:hypothetical protein